MQLGFFFDQTRCIGCQTCVVACKDWNDLPAETVHWRRVTTYEEGKFPDVSVVHVSVSCNHCGRPACAEACPENAIQKREADGVVLIDPKTCTGCRDCENACPYHAIHFRSDDAPIAEKCNFCQDRLANGEVPICVAACPMRALDSGSCENLCSYQGTTRTTKHLPDGDQTTASLFIRVK